jgi:hypothetical protein
MAPQPDWAGKNLKELKFDFFLLCMKAPIPHSPAQLLALVNKD